MTNVVVCFDQVPEQSAGTPATNAGALFRLTEVSPRQLAWYDSGVEPHGRSSARDAARDRVAQAYRFLQRTWCSGDAIFVFGVGRGAVCARELARLLGTIGIWQGDDAGSAVLDHLLEVCTLARTPRTDADWQRIGRLAADLTGRPHAGVPVRYLGLWDAISVPGADRPACAGLTNVVQGRHAVAIDGGPFGHLLTAPAVEQAWFRGAHCDVAGMRGGCLQLADIALDWVLDGAVRAGLRLRNGCRLPSPTEFDALAGSSHTLSLRRVPEGAAVHASVQLYTQARPPYWRRLPARFEWTDREWLARGERLVQAASETPAAAEPRELATAS
ncbi:phospholipase effector Tle1 domain-containing protein [Mycobacterium sp. WMMD1722]|uniref:phospholipase effector Tle1 domain-containing protein n=1 Tax=Mycobacterium sp. WMMD1722 TaxID=3404117 RepID=UPI003BF60AAF